MKVSVIVPVRDEENSIRELVDGLLNQTRPPDEIIITDGGSVDSTAQIIEDYIRQGAPIRLIRAGISLPGRGRNLGAAAAQYDWLGFIDAGIRPAKNWLEALVRRAEQDEEVDVVYGSWTPVTDTFFKECAAIAYVPPPAIQQGILIRPRSIASTLLRRAAWQAVNGFPENLRSAEDLVFMDRVEGIGFHYVHEPSAEVHWNLRPTLISTFKRFLVYSRNNIRAGLWRQWQAAILTRYVVLLLALVFFLLIDPQWSWVPFLLWLAMLAARAVVAIRRNRSCYPASALRNIKRGILVMTLLAALDAAAIIGSIQWLLLDWFRWSPKAAVEAGNGA
ncbi:MAG TPA: glycosyltransferase [Pyrinomonadaceae bacterium]|jgi:glycosyltransferase involved in cell wall biosynthesis|nr:glycosyltransferase [Pyrinomonadaceae bacterium]